mmetsp:Transcript_34248/g.46323  ORF Transcript_34248/g.46323 Transcript_34248/m.46323 type:complete len:99 (+) Transcript_34248:51-347(+)
MRHEAVVNLVEKIRIPVGKMQHAVRSRPKSWRLSTLRRNVAMEILCLENEKFHDAGKPSDAWKVEGKTMKLFVKNDKTRSIERMTGRIEEEFHLKIVM